MPDIAALVTPPKLFDSTGAAANGEIYVRLTTSVPVSGGIATPTQAKGLVTNGVFTALNGGAFTVPVTPEGVGLEIYVELREDKPSGQGQVRGKHVIRRTVAVPDAATVTWDELIDLVPVDTSGDYGIPAWVGPLLSEAVAAGDIAVTARDEAVDAQTAAEAAAASIPSPASITSEISAAVAPKLSTATAATTYAPIATTSKVLGVQRTSGIIDRLNAQAFPAPTTDIPTLAVSGPGGANPVALGTDFLFDTTSVRKVGCYPVTVNQLSTDYIQNQVNGQSGSGAQPWAIEFTTDAADMSMIFRCAVVAKSEFWVWVDGRPVGRIPYIATTNTAAGSKSYFRLTFPAAKTRRIRIYLRGADFGGFRIATGTLAATTPVETVKAAFLGDSWFAGASEGYWPRTIPAVMGMLLGWETFLCGIGGSGYVASATPFSIASRTTPLYAVAPNYVIIQGSINDNSSSGTVGAAAAALYSAIATNLPSAKVIVIGPQPVPSGYATSTNLQANSAAVKAAALAASNVYGFVDPLAGAWIHGTGNIASPAGDGGNADFYMGADNLHPTSEGAAYYARRSVEEIIRLLEKNAIYV